MAEYAWTHYLSRRNELAAAPPDALFRLLTAVLTRYPKARKAELAKLYYDAVLRPGDVSDKAGQAATSGPRLVLVGWLLIASGAYQQGDSFPEFARAVAAHVRDREDLGDDVRALRAVPATEGQARATSTYLNPFWYADVRATVDDAACPFYRSLFSPEPVGDDYAAGYFFGKSLGTDADRQILRDELIKPECGCPRLGVAKVLTWAYRRIDKLDQWTAFLDGRVRDPVVPQEPRAKWLLARGYADEAVGYYPSPWRGVVWIDQALAIDPPEPVREQCVVARAQRCLAVGQFDDGITFLARRSANPLTSDAFKGTIAKLRLDLTLAKAAAADRQSSSNHVQEQALLGAAAASLETRLQAAEGEGTSAAQVDSLRAALAAVRRQLSASSASIGSGTTRP